MLFLSHCYSNNIVLEAGDKYNLNADGSELIIKDVKKVDEGDYTCIAKNKAGEKTEEVSLNVFSKKMSSFVYMLVLRRGFLFLFWPFLSHALTFAAHSSTACPVARCGNTQ